MSPHVDPIDFELFKNALAERGEDEVPFVVWDDGA